MGFCLSVVLPFGEINIVVATAIKSWPATVLSREWVVYTYYGDFRIIPQVSSTHCDRRNLLITLTAGLCLYHVYIMGL